MNWTVAEVMSNDPVTIGPATSFKSCVNLMRIHELSTLPVVTDDRLIGIVSEADLLAKEVQGQVRGRHQHAGRKATALTAVGLMSADLVTTTPDAPLATAASLMFEHHLTVLPVIDSNNRLVGIVSRAHILKVFLRSDESLRREIARGLLDIPLSGRGSIEVEVLNGVVNLRGEVEKASLKDLISRMVAGTPGVVGVQSHFTIAGKTVAASGTHD